jgi:DNA-binding HxlR family transcriptional regulator
MSPLLRTVCRPWAPEILVALRPGPCRFNRLMDVISCPHDKTLSKRLAELKAAGLLERLVELGRPVRVSYQLTEAGQRAAGALAEVG